MRVEDVRRRLARYVAGDASAIGRVTREEWNSIVAVGDSMGLVLEAPAVARVLEDLEGGRIGVVEARAWAVTMVHAPEAPNPPAAFDPAIPPSSSGDVRELGIDVSDDREDAIGEALVALTELGDIVDGAISSAASAALVRALVGDEESAGPRATDDGAPGLEGRAGAPVLCPGRTRSPALALRTPGDGAPGWVDAVVIRCLLENVIVGTVESLDRLVRCDPNAVCRVGAGMSPVLDDRAVARVGHDLRAGWVAPAAAARWATFMVHGAPADGAEQGRGLRVGHAAVTDDPSRCPTCAALDRLLDLGDEDRHSDPQG